jgi:penicillin amidase
VTDPRTEALRAVGRGAAPGDQPGLPSGWWDEELRRRLPDLDATVPLPGLRGPVSIARDDRGIPHVIAGDDHDLFTGYGYAQAQDRLFQLDIQRRKGHGRLAALLGPEGVELDRIAWTIDFPTVLDRHLEALAGDTRALLAAFADGVNAWADHCVATDTLPIEYALLGAAWEPWSVVDALAAALTWRWQLTGRTHVYAGPELLKRHLGGDVALVEAILRASNEGDTPIMPPDAPYPAAAAPWPIGDRGPQVEPWPGDAPGSNNWVVSGSRSRSGLPLLGSDPHMPYQHWSSFHEVGLHGGSFDAVGAGLVGMPGLLFGRNRHLAWGITNNICSLRDLYQERPVGGPDGGPAYEFDGRPEPATIRHARIEVREADPVELEIVVTRNGPIVDDLLPPLARDTGPVSMRWLGTEVCDWTAALLRLDRAETVAGAFAACDGWLVPTFSLLVGDTAGDIGYLATGRIPLRGVPSRTYRPGWDPAHQWLGTIPPDGMPRAISPAQGWLGSANNRPAPDDYPYPLFGTWDEGLRQRRIGRIIEAGGPDGRPLDRSDMTRMHADVRSLRAEDTVPALLALMESVADERARPALALLRDWDRESRVDSAGAAVYQLLAFRWAQACVRARIPDVPLADYLANWCMGLGSMLLTGDPLGWFESGGREATARLALTESLDELETAMGPDPAAWTWGGIHQLLLRHPLSGRGAIADLFDKGPVPVPGDLATLNNSGFDATRDGRGWMALSGAGYRLEVDLGETPPAAWTITGESQSALLGSPYYDDQRDEYVAGRVRRLPLDAAEAAATAAHTTTLTPAGDAR